MCISLNQQHICEAQYDTDVKGSPVRNAEIPDKDKKATSSSVVSPKPTPAGGNGGQEKNGGKTGNNNGGNQGKNDGNKNSGEGNNNNNNNKNNNDPQNSQCEFLHFFIILGLIYRTFGRS